MFLYKRLHTFQTLCTSCPDEAVWHMWRRTGSRLCWGHCLPSRPLLLHYAETKESKRRQKLQCWRVINLEDILGKHILLTGKPARISRYSLLGAHWTRLHICDPIYLFLLCRCLIGSIKIKGTTNRWGCGFGLFSVDTQQMHQAQTCRISGLNHEAFNIAVEDGASVEPTGTQSKEVLWRVKY